MAKLRKPLVIVAHIAVIIGITYTLASAAMFFAFGPATSEVAATVMARPADGPVSTPIEQIAGWHLFGQPPANFDTVAEQTEKLPETRLSLELVGVFVADDPASSMAFIAQKGRQAKTYGVGDRVGSSKLETVFQDRVVITRGGVREQIRFAERKTTLLPVGGPKAEANTDFSDAGAAETVEPAEKIGPAEAIGPNHDSSPAVRALTELRDELERDPQGLLMELEVARISQEGPRGYAVGALAHHPELGHMGLQPGDRILAVNGRAVGDPEQDSLRIEDIIAEGSARLEIERGGERLAVTVSLN